MEFKVYPNKKSPKLFDNSALEALTRSNIYVIDGMYIIISISLMTYYYNYVEANILSILGWFALGFLSWTLAEYLMHRFLYHKLKDASYDTGMQYLFHGIHHQYPHDEDRIVLPPVPSILFAIIFFTAFYLIMGNMAFTFGTGFVMGYIVYITIHWMVHKKKAPEKYNWWWTHHNIHHFQQHDRAFGVSTPIWDIVFRTMPEKGRKTVTIKIGDNEEG